VRIIEPAADLPILLAVHSSLSGRPLPAKTLVFGEVGLAGEIRPVQRGQERIKEAAKLGFRQFLIPSLNKPKQAIDGTSIFPVSRVDEAVAWLRG
jgi:DNA repair protein RadA/Sms